MRAAVRQNVAASGKATMIRSTMIYFGASRGGDCVLLNVVELLPPGPSSWWGLVASSSTGGGNK